MNNILPNPKFSLSKPGAKCPECGLGRVKYDKKGRWIDGCFGYLKGVEHATEEDFKLPSCDGKFARWLCRREGCKNCLLDISSLMPPSDLLPSS